MRLGQGIDLTRLTFNVWTVRNPLLVAVHVLPASSDGPPLGELIAADVEVDEAWELADDLTRGPPPKYIRLVGAVREVASESLLTRSVAIQRPERAPFNGTG